MTIRAVPAVSRAIAILRLLGRSRAPMGVKAIAEALDIVPSTALHILRVLVVEELVRVDADKRYTLGMGTLALASASLETDDFPARVQPHLDALSRRYGVTAIGLALPNLQHMIVVALSRAQAPVRLHVDVGSRFPALISATGRCVAAFGSHPPAEIEKRFKALRWNNAPSWSAWCREVETVRRQGYSIDRDTYIAGVTVVGVPVLDASGRIEHSIASVGITGQLDRTKAVELAHDMQAAARAAGRASALASPA
jgi:DNA-binding IclR family transcriptional regulator